VLRQKVNRSRRVEPDSTSTVTTDLAKRFEKTDINWTAINR
jgi:hypothetical protein